MIRSRSFDLNLVHNHRPFLNDFENDEVPILKGSFSSGLDELARDREIVTDPDETKRRRTIKLTRSKTKSWGFTLQTYGIKNKRTQEVEIMSYVDSVEFKGPAWMAGMRRGDVILSVNGESVEAATHNELVNKIQRSGYDLRLVVLFEDCCTKVELHARYLRLKKRLSIKLKELQCLEEEEKKIHHNLQSSKNYFSKFNTNDHTEKKQFELHPSNLTVSNNLHHYIESANEPFNRIGAEKRIADLEDNVPIVSNNHSNCEYGSHSLLDNTFDISSSSKVSKYNFPYTLQVVYDAALNDSNLGCLSDEKYNSQQISHTKRDNTETINKCADINCAINQCDKILQITDTIYSPCPSREPSYIFQAQSLETEHTLSLDSAAKIDCNTSYQSSSSKPINELFTSNGSSEITCNIATFVQGFSASENIDSHTVNHNKKKAWSKDMADCESEYTNTHNVYTDLFDTALRSNIAEPNDSSVSSLHLSKNYTKFHDSVLVKTKVTDNKACFNPNCDPVEIIPNTELDRSRSAFTTGENLSSSYLNKKNACDNSTVSTDSLNETSLLKERNTASNLLDGILINETTISTRL
ncbi:uncharacterized protein LOC131929609 [Physella acuta]|uniref:uncharacterized protein LOC131929609 n=1 Tax=Physella acuta TaxID=109671 RepID=UPI0027DB6BD7|nr:uncharacterized protein LOC131929609 [Physella acuta]XP_059141879.1 uncharacterized protein LOC131929609 [Physella acuta]XP_059141881.1 uncharacterized protein LOC131929609 [Physella acuta]